MDARAPYASPEWIGAMHDILTGLVEENRQHFPGADFTMCEIITAVPPGGGTVVLGARITGEGVSFFGEEAEADVIIRGDHEAMLPAARLNRRNATPEQTAAQANHAIAMAKAGRISMKGDMRKAPKALLGILSEMHDRLADRTA